MNRHELDRREFLKQSGTILGSACARTLRSRGYQRAIKSFERRPPRAAHQSQLALQSQSRAGGHDKDFNDSAFDRIVIPHTNVKLPWHSFDDKTYEFVSLYRRRFKLPAEARGKHVFVDFEGAMTASTVWINGTKLGEYKGGYTPFSFDLTPHLDFDGENVLAVDLDSTERADIPPFGYEIDYLTFGGIYREVALRIVPRDLHREYFRPPKDVLTPNPRSMSIASFSILEASRQTHADHRSGTPRRRPRPSPTPRKSSGTSGAPPIRPAHRFTSTTSAASSSGISSNRNLYSVHVRLLQATQLIDADSRTLRLPRSALFTDHGFALNGKVIKLRGLDRHQTFPFVGQAMPAVPAPRRASFFSNELKTNIVRTSHYPQSRHFLDACDEIGLLVLEEIPGWQHIGDEPWKHISIDNVGRMIRRDWNHPSIILWGVRINESKDDHDFYTRTNALAHQLDPTRQTGGIRYFQESEFLEDVFTMNDFGFPLKPPNHPRYLNTEFVGHTYPTKTIDQDERSQRAHPAPRAYPRSARFRSAIRRRHRLVRLRLQHPRQLRRRRPHLLSRRHRHLPRTETRRRILQITMRSGRRSRP